jgi:hypothetical protein
VLLIVSCAAETAVPATTTTTTVATTTTAPSPTSTTALATTTTTELKVDVEIRDDEVNGPDRFEYERGEMVSITILSDTAYEVHVHGYELRYDLEIGEPLTVEFIADIPGIFEVETHPDHLPLFEIEVGA